MRLLIAALFIALSAGAAPKRLVIIKADGLPGDVIDRWVRTTDPKTGRSTLPSIESVFVEGGTWVRNFYTRGIRLSAPAWSMLDTGQHLIIRGNAEYDRVTLRVYDHLNFFPFYYDNARARRADMPGVEVLDEAGIPLLIDAYEVKNRYQSMQLLSRGVQWRMFGRSAKNRVTSRSLRQLFDEWQTGFQFSETIGEQVERDMVLRIAGGQTDYIDDYFVDYDHVMHLANDEVSQVQVLKKLDGVVGRLWSTIQTSSRAADTIMVLVSDHGMNSDPATYSQGYNLISFFNSAEGGGHHVITNRYPLTEYKLRGLDPFVNEVISASDHSAYLGDKSQQYPTALLDLDGNERASVQLRNSDWNQMHALLLRIERESNPALRESLAADLLTIVDRKRAAWLKAASEIEEETPALRRSIARQRTIIAHAQKKFTKSEVAVDLDLVPRRERAELANWEQEERGYSGFAQVLRRWIALKQSDLDPGKFRVDQLIPPRMLGEPNTIYDLQNYVTGLASRVDYFPALTGLRVRNNVQPGVAPAPVDLVAVQVDPVAIASLGPLAGGAHTGVFLYADAEHQALLFGREEAGQLMIHYVPVAKLRQIQDGSLQFERRDWSGGFPLRLYEDANLHITGDKAAWLNAWHSDREWLAATHLTMYSNGVIGLMEHFGPVRIGAASSLWDGPPEDTPLLRRFELRKREMADADLLILASNHWNFNVRGFNPGGNHGSFFRVSTNSTLMFAGAGIPRSLTVSRPYDSLSFLPTLVRLLGLEGEVQKRNYPGPVIQELVR